MPLVRYVPAGLLGQVVELTGADAVQPTTETELYGFADSQEAAYRAMQLAIREAGTASPPSREQTR